MYKLKIRKEMKKTSDSLDLEDEVMEKLSELEINETEDSIEIKKIINSEQGDELTLLEELEFIFHDIKINKEDFNVGNIDDIVEKWHIIKKDNIFRRQDKKTIGVIVQISKFYDNGNVLEEIIKNFSHIPFLIFFYKHKNLDIKEEILSVGDIFIDDEINFKLKLEKGKEENEYNIISEISSQFGIVDYRGNLRKSLNIPLSKLFTPDIKLRGKYIYSDHLESMKIEVEISSREDMNYTKTIEIWEE